MKVATWNVNGLRARHAQLLAWVAEEKPDVLCLQEIKATPEQIPDPLTTLHEYWNYWHGGRKGYSGVSIHFRRSTFATSPTFTHPPFDSEFRIVDAVVDGIHFASVYVPNGGKDFEGKMTFLRQLERWTAEMKERSERAIICGDLNVALTDMDLHPTQLEAGIIGTRPEERRLLRSAIEHGLVDLVRTTHADNPNLFTWWPPWRNLREKNVGWRIDFVLVSSELTATSCVVRKEILGSDHAPVVVELGA